MNTPQPTIEYAVSQEWTTFVLRRWIGDGPSEVVRRFTSPLGEAVARAQAVEMMNQLTGGAA